MSDRPLSMTELQTIRAGLEAADNFAAMQECLGHSTEELAAMVEAVHRAMGVVDRRIQALNRRAVERVAGAEPGPRHVADVIAEAVHRAPRLDPDDLHAFAAALAKDVGEPVPPLRVPRAALERAGRADLFNQAIAPALQATCVCGHSRGLHAGAEPRPCKCTDCGCVAFLSLQDARIASGCTCYPSRQGREWTHAPGCRLHVEPKP